MEELSDVMEQSKSLFLADVHRFVESLVDKNLSTDGPTNEEGFQDVLKYGPLMIKACLLLHAEVQKGTPLLDALNNTLGLECKHFQKWAGTRLAVRCKAQGPHGLRPDVQQAILEFLGFKGHWEDTDIKSFCTTVMGLRKHVSAPVPGTSESRSVPQRERVEIGSYTVNEKFGTSSHCTKIVCV